MRIASIPLNEDLRLQDLYAFDILDTDSETEFDELLEVATQIYGCSIAAITFIGHGRQLVKAKKGFDIEAAIPGGLTFCSHVVLQDDVFAVNDATRDERFCNNPNVTGGLRIRFYAGAPIVSKAGDKIGTVCVVDGQPREFSPADATMLKVLSQQVSKLLELRIKNRLLKKRAEEQLKLEKELLHRLLLEQDDHSLQISRELHENIAQGLAATKFYLELAEGNKVEKDELIQKSRRFVELLVKQVKELSHAITPTTLKDFCLEELLRSLLDSFSLKTGVQTKFLYHGNSQLSSSLAMAVYRIVEEQLKHIQQQGGAALVVVNIQVLKCIHLCIKDDGLSAGHLHRQNDIRLQKILSRVENRFGVMDVSETPGNGNQVTITIPLQEKTVGMN